MSDQLPMSGLKVFDATQGVAGPHSTLLLAQYGADVIKIEPIDGDWGRTLGKTYDDFCAHAVAFNRGKRSISLDLKHESGLAVAQRLASDADIVVESFRPGVMSRFKLGYDDLVKNNPEVIYLSVTGFGQHGPRRDLPVTDAVIQAFSGLMSINRDVQGSPQRISMVAIDVMTGLYAYQAIASAVLKRFRFGGGQYIDCSLMQSGAAFQAAKIAEHYLEGGQPQVLYVPVGTMKTKDGFLNVTAMREHHYVSMMQVLGRPELATDPRFDTRDKRIANEAILMPIVREAFLAKTTTEWAAQLTEAGVMNSPVSTYDDFMAEPHVEAVESLVWPDHQGVGKVPMPKIPGVEAIRGGAELLEAPHNGQHSEAILREAGYSDDDIADLVETGAVMVHG
jgi:crotonobetainyl-CoA:carnitine CoA-transferase CaiB-like acyl-CoA transferase